MRQIPKRGTALIAAPTLLRGCLGLRSVALNSGGARKRCGVPGMIANCELAADLRGIGSRPVDCLVEQRSIEVKSICRQVATVFDTVQKRGAAALELTAISNFSTAPRPLAIGALAARPCVDWLVPYPTAPTRF